MSRIGHLLCTPPAAGYCQERTFFRILHGILTCSRLGIYSCRWHRVSFWSGLIYIYTAKNAPFSGFFTAILLLGVWYNIWGSHCAPQMNVHWSWGGPTMHLWWMCTSAPPWAWGRSHYAPQMKVHWSWGGFPLCTSDECGGRRRPRTCGRWVILWNLHDF